MEELDQNKLLHELKQGSPDAFYKIYECYNHLIYNLAIQYLQNSEDARDIVQETFIKLWESRKKLDDHKSLINYIYTIAKNQCINILQKRKNSFKYRDILKQKEISFKYKAIYNTDPSILFKDEIQKIVKQVLDESSPEARKIFSRSRHSGETNKEIAKDLNISIKTVEYHISKVLKLLRIRLKEFLVILINISMLT